MPVDVGKTKAPTPREDMVWRACTSSRSGVATLAVVKAQEGAGLVVPENAMNILRRQESKSEKNCFIVKSRDRNSVESLHVHKTWDRMWW
jgi:hypothetical protein